MHSDLLLALVLTLSGLVVGSVIVFAAPRLVAYRLDTEPEVPRPVVLAPIIGAFVLPWRPMTTCIAEVGCAVVYAGLALHYGRDIRLPIACGYTAILIAIAYIDFEHRLVLNRLSYPGIGLALIASVLWPGIGLGSAAIGAGIALVAFMVLQVLGRGALGTGDTKLAVLIGAMRGMPGSINALLLGIIFGGLAGVFFLVILRRDADTTWRMPPI